MADSIQVAAFEGGALRVFSTGEKSREAVLALPLSRLIVKMLRVNAEQREDMVGFATPVLQALSPFPDDPLAVSCEVVRESETSTVVIAAALPETSTDDIAEALDGAKLSVTRVDALVLGQVRGLWAQIGAEGGALLRRLVVLAGPDCLSLLVLDGDSPVAIRAVGLGDDLRREVVLSLLEAEDFGGPRELAECVTVGEVDESVLSAFAPVRKVVCDDADLALKGVAERAQAGDGLDALPDSWREMLAETRFKGKLTRAMIAAGAIWLLAMGVLFGVPVAYGYMTDHQKGLCRAHQKQYRAVAEMRDRVKLVRKYSDHARGALEMLRTVSEQLPEGVELNSWNYKREEGVKVSGVSFGVNPAPIYEFKNAMVDTAVFPTVELKGPLASKGDQKFDLECLFGEEEE